MAIGHFLLDLTSVSGAGFLRSTVNWWSKLT
uniref:Uncharacterized protein n=1 Tax=Rhizophora mucronata TaxID=61149 RepID=A0A2P2INC7_RHIMU